MMDVASARSHKLPGPNNDERLGNGLDLRRKAVKGTIDQAKKTDREPGPRG